MLITRRNLITGFMLAGGYCFMPMGLSNWALAAPNIADRHMVVVFMRGAVDGLSVVAPYREQNYYQIRRSIALPPPGQSGGLIDMNGFFGMNPAMAPLMPWWQNRSMAFIHASGSPAATRSHFEAQDVMESAMLNSAMAKQGWLSGLAQSLPDNHSPTRVVNFGNVLPKILQGRVEVASVPVNAGGNKNQGGNKKQKQAGKGLNRAQDDATVDAFSKLYSKQSGLGDLYKQGLASQAGVQRDLQPDASEVQKYDAQMEMQASAKGAPGTDAFVKEATNAGDMIRRDPTIQLVFMDVGGWDTHVQQGGVNGQLANKLGKFSEGIAALAQSLGQAYKNTVILVVSEFGRTAAENGNGGTDHGHGNVTWLLGGGVKGGIYSRWPGLNTNQLHEGRDLEVTTDFRSIVGAVINQHFGIDDQRLVGIIPGYQRDNGLNGLIT